MTLNCKSKLSRCDRETRVGQLKICVRSEKHIGALKIFLLSCLDTDIDNLNCIFSMVQFLIFHIWYLSNWRCLYCGQGVLRRKSRKNSNIQTFMIIYFYHTESTFLWVRWDSALDCAGKLKRRVQTGRLQTCIIKCRLKYVSGSVWTHTSPMTAMGVTPLAWATLCSIRKYMYSSYSKRIRWKEPKLAALRRVRSRITIELVREQWRNRKLSFT